MEVQNVEIGQIYRIKANEQNDITPKDGLLFRAKYIVVIGFDSQGNVYGPRETYVRLRSFGIL